MLGAALAALTPHATWALEEPPPAQEQEQTQTQTQQEPSPQRPHPPQAERPGAPAPDAAEAFNQDRVILPQPLSTEVPPVEVASDDPSRGHAVQVLLELVIDERGHVERSTVLSGPVSYALAARRASSNWSFAPAMQNGEAVRARIQFMVNFAIPAESQGSGDVKENAAESSTLSRSARSQEGEVLREVVVLGDLRHPSGKSVTRGEVENLAGAFGDPLRAVEALPGVTPTATGFPIFFVRGAPPGNVGYFADGIRLPFLYHAFLGPSVIHPAFIRKVTLHGGPSPTEFGRYAGAAVEAELAPLPTARTAEASIRLLDAGGYAASPFAGERGAVQLAGRYSYTGLVISALAPDAQLNYWDYQGRVAYQLGNDHEVSLFALGAYDYFNVAGELLGAEFHRVDARYRHDFSPNDHLRVAITWGSDRTRTQLGFVSNRILGARMNFEHAQKQALFRAGTDLWVDTYDSRISRGVSEPEIYQDLFPARTDAAGGVWADVVLQASNAFHLIPGVRVDLFRSLGETRVGVDPRLTAEYRLSPRVKAIHSIGVAHQTPNFVPNVPGAMVAGVDGGLQRSLQAETEYQAELPWDLTGSVALFINGTENLTDPIGLNQNFAIDETSNDQRVLGRAAGFELYLKRALTRRLGGLLSYTFSRTMRSFDGVNTLNGYDRTHVLNAAATYDLAWGIRASAKFAFSSGIPGRRTRSEDGVVVDSAFVFDESRSRPYVRLDAKVEKRFEVSENFDWGIHAEVLNATNTGNVTTRSCTARGCEDRGTLPITLPSLGVDARWK